MPTLEWIGKEKVINHHNEVPYRLLERKYSYDEKGMHLEDNESNNMVIHGDNLEALKALLPRYEGQIKCIYIDPPYNTKNEEWVYNDNVNDPRIRKWLGQVVGKEGEDLSRHDKWLCMMYPRLKMLQKLLHKEGAIAISIGYHEMHNLMCLCKEIFSTKQVVAIPVQTSGGKPSGGFNYLHEYIIFIVPQDFEPNGMSWNGGNQRTPYEGLTLSTYDKTKRPNQTYPIFVNSTDGSFAGVGESLQEKIDKGIYVGEKSAYEYDYNCAPEGTVAVWPVTTKGKECVWRQIPDRLVKDWEKGYIKISPSKNQNNKNQYSVQYLPKGVIKKIEKGELEIIGHEEGVPTLKFGDNETAGGQVPTIWNEKVFFTVNGTKELKKIFPEVDKKFDYPKSVELVKSVIEALSNPGDVIVDSFGGSATTAQAVLELNEEFEDRNFIIIEMMDYADELTAERVKRVISGYGVGEDAKNGTGGNFSYYELGQSLFDKDGQLLDLDESIINEYLWYIETRKPYLNSQDEKFFLGQNCDVAYYSLYNRNNKVTLNYDTLGIIKRKCEAYVIYADACTLSGKELARLNITFKKIPRDIARV